MTDMVVVPHAHQWSRLKTLVLDSVSSPITKRVYNLGLDEFFAWFAQEPRPGFSKATASSNPSTFFLGSSLDRKSRRAPSPAGWARRRVRW